MRIGPYLEPYSIIQDAAAHLGLSVKQVVATLFAMMVSDATAAGALEQAGSKAAVSKGQDGGAGASRGGTVPSANPGQASGSGQDAPGAGSGRGATPGDVFAEYGLQGEPQADAGGGSGSAHGQE